MSALAIVGIVVGGLVLSEIIWAIIVIEDIAWWDLSYFWPFAIRDFCEEQKNKEKVGTVRIVKRKREDGREYYQAERFARTEYRFSWLPLSRKRDTPEAAQQEANDIVVEEREKAEQKAAEKRAAAEKKANRNFSEVIGEFTP